MTFPVNSNQIKPVGSFETNQGAQIFRLSLEAFPGFWVYSYLVLFQEFRVLIDTGSNMSSSNDCLEEGLRQVSDITGTKITIKDITHALITHGHIDHFGGVEYLKKYSNVNVGVHELDLRILTNYEERLAVVSQRLKDYLVEAGVPVQDRGQIIDMYMMPKALFNSVDVNFTYEKIGMKMGPFHFLHVPGHCAGQVVIRIHDVLFTGDHILSKISPHQSPERLALNTGLRHYLQSLDSVRDWVDGVHLILDSHNDPFFDISSRVEEIKIVHRDRLVKIYHLLKVPSTIQEVSDQLFGEVYGYNILLALQESGAHIEYLYQDGVLGIENLRELEQFPDSTPIRYRCLGESYSPRF